MMLTTHLAQVSSSGGASRLRVGIDQRESDMLIIELFGSEVWEEDGVGLVRVSATLSAAEGGGLSGLLRRCQRHDKVTDITLRRNNSD